MLYMNFSLLLRVQDYQTLYLFYLLLDVIFSTFLFYSRFFYVTTRLEYILDFVKRIVLCYRLQNYQTLNICKTWSFSKSPSPSPPLLLPQARLLFNKRGGYISQFQPSQRRAYAQQLVTTRLLDYLHDPARQLSRLQRIQSCALYNCNTPANSLNFNETANAGLVRFWAKGLFVSDWCRRKHPVLAWILAQRRSAIIQQMVASRQCLVRQPQKPII